jgi:hypothetical protein
MNKLIIDDSFFHLIDRCYFDSSNGYWRVRINDGYEYLHRIVAMAKTGEIVDHINRDKNDNRSENLRIASKSLNNYNKPIINSLGRGIYFDSYGKRFRACISFNGKTLKLGSFSNANDAKMAYNIKAKEIYGSDAYQHQIEVKK